MLSANTHKTVMISKASSIQYRLLKGHIFVFFYFIIVIHIERIYRAQVRVLYPIIPPLCVYSKLFLFFISFYFWLLLVAAAANIIWCMIDKRVSVWIHTPFFMYSICCQYKKVSKFNYYCSAKWKFMVLWFYYIVYDEKLLKNIHINKTYGRVAKAYTV